MWNTLYNLFKKEHCASSIRDIANEIGSLMFIVQKEYLKDENSRDIAIDAICEIIQTHKSNKQGK